MNEVEYKQWRADALVMLNFRYTSNESRVIIEWMALRTKKTRSVTTIVLHQ